jgi:hypothetical protein
MIPKENVLRVQLAMPMDVEKHKQNYLHNLQKLPRKMEAIAK